MPVHPDDPKYWTKTLKALRPKMRQGEITAPSRAMVKMAKQELLRIDPTLHQSLLEDGELPAWAMVVSIRSEEMWAGLIADGVEPSEAQSQAIRDVILNYDPNQMDEQERRESEQLPL